MSENSQHGMQAPSAFQFHEPAPMAARVRGLPRALPAGETMLWQGAPGSWAMLRDAFHIRAWGFYVLALLAWRAGSALADGRSVTEAALTSLYGAMLGAFGLGVFAFFAWLIARTTTYTITSKRVVITYGMAVEKSLNVPFTIVEAAKLGLKPDGSGNIPLTLEPKSRLSYLLLWPHARPGKGGRVEPMLRCLAGAQPVAQLLGAALAGKPAHLVAPVRMPMPEAAIPCGETAAA
jgi:hypothetical protein